MEGRAARYAALADPVRLRIVDLLTLGDVAPVEVQRELGISSALLSHHLGALERAGFLTRTRSEADRRRTYLRLAPGAFEALLPSPALAARRVVFVCTGNSARSQLAAALWRQASDVPATSAGTHPAERVEPGAITTAERHGLDLASATPRALDGVLAADDVVVTGATAPTRSSAAQAGCTGRCPTRFLRARMPRSTPPSRNWPPGSKTSPRA